MKATKIFIVLVIKATISLVVMGVTQARYNTNQASFNPNSSYADDFDFGGSFRGCSELILDPYYYQYQSPSNTTIEPTKYIPHQQPYQPQNPNLDYNEYEYIRGYWGG